MDLVIRLTTYLSIPASHIMCGVFYKYDALFIIPIANRHHKQAMQEMIFNKEQVLRSEASEE
jgi:hypothetical protein